MVGTRRSRRAGLLVLAAAVIAGGAFAIWLGAGPGEDRDVILVRTETGNPGAVGTSGTLAPDADRDPAASAAVIRDVETITGSTDGHALVGRRVDLQVPVSRHINDVAFWVGTGDNRLLVVLARDRTGGSSGTHRNPVSSPGLDASGADQVATVSGSIQRVPHAEAMYSWGLTNADRAELMERRVYLKADRVSGS